MYDLWTDWNLVLVEISMTSYNFTASLCSPYLYHKARDILQERAWFVVRGVSRGSVRPSICKTVSGHVIHNSFSADNFFRAKDYT
jgi:hypothetical protein